MSGEYDDVLTNQPVVIDNVNFLTKKKELYISNLISFDRVLER
jgi:hypothetical protein